MGLVYNATTGKTEYLVELAGGSNGPITINFAYMQDTEPSNPQEKDVWFDTTNNKIYTYKNGQWTDQKDPQVGVFYLYNDEYYLWDGNSLEKTDLNIYEKIENKTDNFIEDSSVKYPSSKALSDGLKSVEPNLYDIKTLSQAIINKGWTYLCNATKQMLPKAKIPTVYDDIENKYLNCDKELSEFQKVAVNKGDLRCNYFYNEKIGKYCYVSFARPYKIYSSVTPNLATTTLEYTNGDDMYGYGAAIGKNIVVVPINSIDIDNIRYYRFDIFDRDFNYLRRIMVNGGSTRKNNEISIWFRRDTFIVAINGSYGDNDAYQFVVTIKDDINVSSGTFYQNFFGYDYLGSQVFDLGENCPLTNVVDDTFVYMITTSRNRGKRTYKFNLDTGEVTNCGSRTDGDTYSNLCYHNGKFYQIMRHNNSNNIYESSDCASWTLLGNFNTDKIGMIISVGNFCLCFGSNNIYSTADFLTFTVYESNISTNSNLYQYYRNYIQTDDYFFTICYISTSGTVPYNFFGSTLIPKVYTAPYTINGSTVNIQYYKNQDWKICISDGGTNDTNLDTIYNGLGYENYWLLDRNNEQLCLPRNSNLYTQMYVGDDYEDITTPNGNSTRLLPQSNLITDMTSASITFDSTNKVQPNTDYEYGELTTLTLDSSSIIGSKLGTTIKFQSGTTATTITDSSNIQWVDGSTPEPSASKTCLIFIWDNIGFYKEW